MNNHRNREEEYGSKMIHNGVIFLSIFIQIILKHISTPLKMFRDFLEGFILNRGVPHRDSDEYYTFVGHLDYRLDLDKNIKREDARYYPALSMMASKLAYENKAVIQKTVTNHWKMELVAFYNFYNEFQHKSTTQAYIFREKTIDGDVIVVAFRGTSILLGEDWSTDFDFSWVKIDGMGKAHMGFMLALGLHNYSHNGDDYLGHFFGSWPKKIEQDPQHPLAYYTIREKLKELMKDNENAKFIVTGHSLGGALAVLFSAVLLFHGEEELVNKLEGVYTFGQPRVGDEEFGEFMKYNMRKHNIKYKRIVFGYDIVPQVPFDDVLMTFKHFGKCIHFNCFYHGKIIEEERKWEGSIILWLQIRVITMIINMGAARLEALWELIRGPFMGIIKGPEYREGWILFGSRIVAIFIPSIINHSPQDYVNATRLASQDLFYN